MREIKFRAWNNQEKHYVETDDIVISIDGGPVLKTFAKEIYGWTSDIEIEQYTGLHDKNGREIYEGDIVQYGDNQRDIYEVKFGEFGVPDVESERYVDKSVGFYLVVIGPLKNVFPFNMTIPLNEHYANSYAVIGNIHEDPELLEVDQ